MTSHEPRLRADVVNFPVRIQSLLSLASLACAFTACARVPGQFEIVNNQVPTGSCAIPVNETVYQGQGLLDARLVQPGAQSAFYVFPLIRNNLPGSTEDGPDSNQITLTSFAVDIRFLSGPDSVRDVVNLLDSTDGTRNLLHYKTPWSGSVGSAGGTVSAWVAAFPVELSARLLAAQGLAVSPNVYMNLQIRSFGRTTTRDIESDPFDYPIGVCAGCLIANNQPCPYTSPPLNTGNPCNIAQDAPVDCCTNGNDLVCPPSVVAQ